MFPDKEEVPGSSPGSPTPRISLEALGFRECRAPDGAYLRAFQATTWGHQLRSMGGCARSYSPHDWSRSGRVAAASVTSGP